MGFDINECPSDRDFLQAASKSGNHAVCELGFVKKKADGIGAWVLQAAIDPIPL